MSRFFRQAGDSDSESESSDEESLRSDEEEAPAKPTLPPGQKPMSRFLRTEGPDSDSSSEESDKEDGSDNDDDDDDAPKKKSKYKVGAADSGSDSDRPRGQVRPARDKRLEEMETTSKSIDNAVKINDWVAISGEFEKLIRLVQQHTNVGESVPPLYLRVLTSLDNSITTASAKEKDAKKKMNASNARALTATKQKVKKNIKEHETLIKAYTEDSEKFERDYNAAQAPEPVLYHKKASRKPTDVGEELDDDTGFETTKKGGNKVYTSTDVYKTLAQVNEARGKKNTDRAEQMRILEKILVVANNSYAQLRVLLALLAARFDYNPSASHMPIETWLSAQTEIIQVINLTMAEPQYVIQEVVTEDYDELIERTPSMYPDGIVRIRGSVISFIDRLDDEFTRSLQNIDPHGTEYVDRLKDEKGLYETICRSQAYFHRTQQQDQVARVVMRRLEHIYSKPDAVVEALEQVAGALKGKSEPPVTLANLKKPSALIHALCVQLYKTGNSLLRTRAMLCHIFHHALHNEYHTARDMLLMSHLQESIHVADVGTQILYNRTVVQLGLCAFRSGLIKEAQATLQDIFTTQRVKELLAQGVHQQKYTVLTPEQEKAERSRQLPFHMHINTELLEAAFLVSSMLVEIPLLASIDSEEAKRKAISKPFRRLLDFADRQVFSGPPESTRDHIMQASKALQDGEWEKCRDLIQSIKIWSLMPEEKTVKDMLARRIQEEGLRTYLFTYAPYYTTLSLTLLSRTFSLPIRTVTSTVSKMIWSEELAASLDQASGVVVFHRVEPTRLQQLAQSLADKVGALVEQNEKTLDQKLGGGSGGGWGGAGGGEGKGGAKPGGGGDQTERRGERRGGGARGGTRGGRGGRFAQGLGVAQRPRT